jgi:hypothetical protein
MAQPDHLDLEYPRTTAVRTLNRWGRNRTEPIRTYCLHKAMSLPVSNHGPMMNANRDVPTVEHGLARTCS